MIIAGIGGWSVFVDHILHQPVDLPRAGHIFRLLGTILLGMVHRWTYQSYNKRIRAARAE